MNIYDHAETPAFLFPFLLRSILILMQNAKALSLSS
jgi:hypothetical protein